MIAVTFMLTVSRDGLYKGPVTTRKARGIKG